MVDNKKRKIYTINLPGKLKFSINIYVLSLFLTAFCGLLLLFIVFMGEFFWGIEEFNFYSLIFFFIQHTAVTLLIFAFVIIIFEMYFRTETMQDVEDSFNVKFKILSDNVTESSKTIENKMQVIEDNVNNHFRTFSSDFIDFFSIIKSSKRAHISNIFAKRINSRENIERDLENILIVLNNIDYTNFEPIYIDLLGVTLKDFSIEHYKVKFSKIVNEISKIEKKLSENKMQNSEELRQNPSICFRIMLQYPYSNSAIIRSIRETFESDKFEDDAAKFDINIVKNFERDDYSLFLKKYIHTRLYQHASQSAMQFYKWKIKINNKKNSCISFQIKLITHNPMAHIVRFNDEMYIEPYHFGMTYKEPMEGQDTITHGTLNISSGTKLIEQFLMIKTFRSDFKFWKFDLFANYRDHFEYFWNHDSSIEIEKLVDVEGNIVHFKKPEQLDNAIIEKIGYNLAIYD